MLLSSSEADTSTMVCENTNYKLEYSIKYNRNDMKKTVNYEMENIYHMYLNEG